MALRRSRVFLMAFPLVAALAAAFVAPAPSPLDAFEARLTAASAQPAQPQDEYVPIDELPQQEQLPAAPMLVAAYAVVWVALLVYVATLWRRLAKVDRELDEVARRIERTEPR